MREYLLKKVEVWLYQSHRFFYSAYVIAKHIMKSKLHNQTSVVTTLYYRRNPSQRTQKIRPYYQNIVCQKCNEKLAMNNW